MIRRLILALSLVTALFLVEFCYLNRSLVKNAWNTVIKKIPAQTTQVFDWKVPELPKDYNWVQSNATQTEMQDNRMIFDNTRAVGAGKIPLANEVYGDIITTGKIFKATVTDKDALYSKASTFLFSEGDFSLDGWSQSIEFGNYYISGVAASGVQGEVLGYVKRDGYMIRTIVYGHNAQWSGWEGPGSEPTCPCSIQMTIFVGDPVDLRNYIKDIK